MVDLPIPARAIGIQSLIEACVKTEILPQRIGNWAGGQSTTTRKNYE